MANTPIGIETLSDWFLHPADPATVVQRQQAVAELAPALEMRQELHRRGLKVAERKTDPGRFLDWAEAEPWLAQAPVVEMGLAMPAGSCSWSVVLLAAFGHVTAVTVDGSLRHQRGAGKCFLPAMHEIFASISTRHGEIGHYADLFQCDRRKHPSLPTT